MAVKKIEMFETRSGRLIATEEKALKVDREESVSRLLSFVYRSIDPADSIEAVLKFVMKELPSPCTNKQLKELIKDIMEVHSDIGDDY